MGEPLAVRAGAVHAGVATMVAAMSALYAFADGPARNLAVVVANVVPLVVALVLLVRRHGGTTRPWWAVVVGLVALEVVNIGGLVAEGIRDQPSWSSPVSWVAQAVGYLGLLVGCAGVTLPRRGRLGHGTVDAAIVGIAIASAVWAAALGPVMTANGAGAGSQVFALVVVVLVSAITGVVGRAAVLLRTARAPITYLLLGAVSTWIGTVAGGLTVDPTTGAEAGWIRHCWIVGYLALAGALAHPTFGRIAAARGSGPGRLTGRRLAFLGVALSANPLIATVQQLAGVRPDAMLLAVGSLALVPLVLARIAGLARLHADAEAQLALQATRDELTGLPNRRALTAHLEHAVTRLHQHHSDGLVVLFCDLDDFKDVNDGYGHHVGDRLLIAVARRLRGAIRAGDIVGRFGGDEFVVLVEGDPGLVEPAVVASLTRALADPVHLAEVTASAAASIGAASARVGERVTAEQLLSAADAAMYAVKRSRHGTGTR